MKRRTLLGAPALAFAPGRLLAQGGGASATRGSDADRRAIESIEARWEAAWNNHDIDAMVRLFAPDAGVVNLAGEWFEGREAFAKSLEELHSAKTAQSVWATERVRTSFLTPEIAVVHVYFNSSGERNPDGTPMPPRRGIFTRVEQKRAGRWVIVASQATRIVPRETAGATGAGRAGETERASA